MTGAAPPPLRVLIVDDHPVVRAGLRAMLVESPFEVAGEAATGTDAVLAVADDAVDVMLLDMRLPDLDGLAVLAQIRQRAPRVAVIILTVHAEPDLVRRTIATGAAGYLLKGVGRAELIAAIEAVAQGEAVLDRALLQSAVGAAARESEPREPSEVGALSPVELDVLALIALGLTNREIAGRLRWSVSTVKKYVQQILEKLEVSDRTQAAVVGLRHGLIGKDSPREGS